jgi:pimeloyl-ACP methyl ester carboxylesterase
VNTLEDFVLSKNLRDITLILHDFGGPIGMAFALKHPERIKNIVILNSWLWSAKGDPDYEKFAKILKSPLLPFLYRSKDLIFLQDLSFQNPLGQMTNPKRSCCNITPNLLLNHPKEMVRKHLPDPFK